MRSLLAAATAALALAACSRDISVPAARPLTLTPATSAVAPRERITFSAAGGAAGYRYAFSGTPGSGSDATLDAGTGAYRAGAAGPATDVVEVTDQAGARVTATVSVGTALTISPQIALAAPGGKTTFTADGGLAPYAFSFQHKGNRSGGRIDGVTGEYTAGPNPGTQDLVQVIDAAGAVARPASPIYVGALHVTLPGGASQLQLADLNGDGRQDVVALEPATGGARRLTTTLLLPGGVEVGETYFTYGDSISGLDLDGDGRDDLFSGSSGNIPASIYLPDASGHLVERATRPAATTGRLPYLTSLSGACAGGSGVYRLSWNAGLGDFDALSCVTAIGSSGLSHLGDLAEGRFDGNVITSSVVWLERDNFVPFTAAGTPQLHYTTATGRVLPIPGTLSAVLPTGGARQQLAAGDLRGVGTLGAPSTDTAVLLAHGASGRNLLFVVPSFTAGAGPSWPGSWLDPFPSGPPALGLARCPPLPGTTLDTLATWNGSLKAEVVAVDGSGVPSASAAYVAPVYVPISVGVCGDVNGDGVPDLVVASDSTSTMAVLWGDGDGGFGRRPHFQATPVFTMAQVDGDGVGDVVVATEAPSLVTYLGDAHQLARVAETPIGMAPAGLWAGDLGGATTPGWAGDLVLADTQSNLHVVPGSTSGVFGRPVQIRDAPSTSGRIPRIVRVAFANLGGTAVGQDLVVLYELKSPGLGPSGQTIGNFQIDAIVRPAVGQPKVVSHAFQSFLGADVQPVDLDGNGVDELVVAVGTSTGSLVSPAYGWRPVRLRVDPVAGSVTPIGNAPPFQTISTATATPFVAAGRAEDVVVFTRSTGELELVSGSGADPTVVTTTLPGGLQPPPPRQMGNVAAPGRATLGVVNPVTGAPVLVFATGASVWVLPGVLSGGKLAGFAPGVTAKAPGVLAGIAPQGGTSAADVLVFTGEELIPLVWTGTVLK